SADDFRGLYYDAIPEASLARDSIDSDALWRVSDSVALVGQASVRLDDGDLLTTAAGLVVERSPRFSYSVGGRFVEPLDLILAVGGVRYELSDRYLLSGSARFDIEEGDVRNTTVGIQRRFDRIALNIGLFRDNVDDDQGIRFSFIPIGVPGAALGTDTFDRFN
ncbi:MAG: hypothetical protein AAGK78_17715, partial [Planctomycetota bacterium]